MGPQGYLHVHAPRLVPQGPSPTFSLEERWHSGSPGQSQGCSLLACFLLVISPHEQLCRASPPASGAGDSHFTSLNAEPQWTDHLVTLDTLISSRYNLLGPSPRIYRNIRSIVNLQSCMYTLVHIQCQCTVLPLKRHANRA